MPSCPVCGKAVQAGTQYCPTCSTKLQPSYGTPAIQTPTQLQTPTYSPEEPYAQQGTSMPPETPKRSNGKLILIVVGAVLISLLVGFMIGYSQPLPADYTNLTGSVSLGSQYPGTANLIMFNSTVFGNLTSAIISNNYLINLPIGDTYYVSLQYLNGTGSFRCIPTLNSFTSIDRNATQDFYC
jgi:hypothetical protein